jgi:hypothetical protein
MAGTILPFPVNLYVVLHHGRNPDIPGGYWREPVDSGRPRRVHVDSLQEASRVVREYIERNGLGAGNCCECPVIDESNTKVAIVSYNGRVWSPEDDWKARRILARTELEPGQSPSSRFCSD